MAEPRVWFEDLVPGEDYVLGSMTLSEADIVAFASAWDPQPMHLSRAAASETFLGDLTASGWHTCCILMRLMCDGFLRDAAGMGAASIEEVRWLEPVHPGDTLTGKRTVLEARRSRSRPDLGIVRCRYVLVNQRGVTVLVATFPAFYACRTSAEVAT
jgi:acyl dehydratase